MHPMAQSRAAGLCTHENYDYSSREDFHRASPSPVVAREESSRLLDATAPATFVVCRHASASPPVAN